MSPQVHGSSWWRVDVANGQNYVEENLKKGKKLLFPDIDAIN